MITAFLSEGFGAGPGPRQANDTLRMPSQASSYGYATENAFGNLSFVDPVAIVTPAGENNRVFVLEQAGKIIVVPDLNAPSRGLFLDLADRVGWGNPSEEGGLLGLAFHPNYANNGQFFVYYVCNTSSAQGHGRHNRLSRFTRSAGDPNRADKGSEAVLFSQFDEEFNHNGGTLLFGPDGYLYLTLGDEGHPNDVFDNAQRIDKDFFSTVIRIDVDDRPGSLPPNPHPALGGQANYRVPPDNPFVGATSFNGVPVNPARVRTEFWAIGLRSPWRMFWDFPTDTAYLSDVGEESGEEINLLVRGGNYGWPYRLADDPGPKAGEAPPGFDSIPPLLTYPRGNSGPYVGRAVIGGVVYRGGRFPELNGAYVFGDFYAGNLWMLRHSGNGLQQWQLLAAESQSSIVSFGVDPQNGDVLICDVADDSVKRLVRAPANVLPPTLADTGAFTDLQTLEPHDGIVPYDINVPFWSDGADKRRWFSIPNPDQKIRGGGRGPWSFPVGTVWIKQFDLEMVKGDPSTARRLETRFLVRDAHGIYGVTYKWNDAQDNATLVGEGGEDQAFTVIDNGVARQQTWHFPARNECISCHTPVAGFALGFNGSQLNRKVDHPDGTANQLQALKRAGYFHGKPGNTKALVDPANGHARLEARVRSYLAANCANCHQPGGPGRGLWDARITTPTRRAGLINGALSEVLGDPAARVIAPQSPEKSILLYRMTTTDPRHRMPPLSSSVPDFEAASMVAEWIDSLPVKRKPLAARIKQPRGTRSADARVALRGSAKGDSLARVVYMLNDGPEQSAAGAVEWSAEVLLEPGRNELIVYAEDSSGNRSRPVRRFLTFKPPRTDDAARHQQR